MAITRLTDLITVFESKWTYGDSRFEYDFEVNTDHNTQYPLIQIEPPISTIPAIYNGREEYEFEINFFNLYSQAAQSVVVLQQRWDNLQDLALEWLDNVLMNYQTSTDVEVFLNDESVEIERVKEVANDRLVQIKLTFTISSFTKCFTPQSFYPSNLSNLRLWLKADSVGTYDIPTKEITSWTDRSGNGFNASQTTKAKKPLWRGYDGSKDKSYVAFDGTDDYMLINTNMLTSADFSMFFVFKQDDTSADAEYIFNINTTAQQYVAVYCDTNVIYTHISDSAGNSRTLSGGVANRWNIVELALQGDSMEMRINGADTDATIGSYATPVHSGNSSVGARNQNSGSNISKYFDGNIQEAIVYNGFHTDKDRTSVRNYLSTKYNITVS
jgi:hypothetical protein